MPIETPPLIWGHLNVNVSDLERSISFYETLGFEIFRSGIPYLGLVRQELRPLPASMTRALGVSAETRGKACILQLDDGLPKLDLIELDPPGERQPLTSQDTGLVRLCLGSRDLDADVARLRAAGVELLSEPQSDPQRLARVAVCLDPDGTAIELIEVDFVRWNQLPAEKTVQG
ncbi:MAG: VOC family protein [Acidobacteriota bacterium]